MNYRATMPTLEDLLQAQFRASGAATSFRRVAHGRRIRASIAVSSASVSASLVAIMFRWSTCRPKMLQI